MERWLCLLGCVFVCCWSRSRLFDLLISVRTAAISSFFISSVDVVPVVSVCALLTVGVVCSRFLDGVEIIGATVLQW